VKISGILNLQLW